MKHVIVGAGAAGVAAAKTVRELRPEDEIVMISADTAVHSRCMLHKFINGERDEKALSFVSESFFEDSRIRWLPGVSVTSLDTVNRQVGFAGGAESFDRLLIATGAVSVIPPIGQLKEGNNVYGLRSLDDAKAIRSRAAKAEHIVVIGAGLVGLDAAYALLEMGKKPVIVEMTESILALNLDPHAAAAYQERFEAAGCVFHLGRKVSGTEMDAAGGVSKLLLDDGRALPCDMVIVAAGVRPAAVWLEGSGIALNRSVTVDPYLASSAAGIYAAGDAAGLSGIWPNAVKQGETAARNMCGLPTVYEDSYALKNTVNFFGLQSLSVGRFTPQEGDTVESREDRKRYEKVILRDGAAVGVILQGDLGGGGFWQYLIKNKIKITGLGKSVWRLSYADFYAVDSKGEYSWRLPA